MKISPLKAIREKCLDCCCGDTKEVSSCSVDKCPIFPFRFGKNPYRTKREYTEEELAVLHDRMKHMRECKANNNENQGVINE